MMARDSRVSVLPLAVTGDIRSTRHPLQAFIQPLSHEVKPWSNPAVLGFQTFLPSVGAMTSDPQL